MQNNKIAAGCNSLQTHTERTTGKRCEKEKNGGGGMRGSNWDTEMESAGHVAGMPFSHMFPLWEWRRFVENCVHFSI